MFDSNLLTLRELAERLGLPIGWLRVEADAGRIPFLIVSRGRRFNADAVEDVLLARAAREGVQDHKTIVVGSEFEP